MATISHSDLAPDAKVHYSLAGAEFDLTAKGKYESDSAEVIGNAQAHPWLKVEFPAVASGSNPDEVVVEFPHTAIDASLDQKVESYEGEESDVPIAETLEADDAQGDEPIVVEDPADDDNDGDKN